jgi:AraC-like DNA-binding protein
MMLVLVVNYYASYRGTEAVFDRRQRDLERLRPLFEYIDENYATPMTIGDAASQVFMSKSHFTRFFRQVTGHSFISYLNRFRVSRAQLLMTNTGLSLAEISQNVGFCDQSYFGLIFKQLVHMTPREFKENRQKITPLPREN